MCEGKFESSAGRRKQPGKGVLNDPAFSVDDKAVGVIRSFREDVAPEPLDLHARVDPDRVGRSLFSRRFDALAVENGG
jgi:hypothetical protein